jgi:hypothetical protein
MYGSVRGVPGNRHSYRDPKIRTPKIRKIRSQAVSLQHFLDDGRTQVHHGKILEPSAKSPDGGPYT